MDHFHSISNAGSTVLSITEREREKKNILKSLSIWIWMKCHSCILFARKRARMTSVLYWRRSAHSLVLFSLSTLVGEQNSKTPWLHYLEILDKWLAWWETFITLLTLQHKQLGNRGSGPITHMQPRKQTHGTSLKWNLRGCVKALQNTVGAVTAV